MTRIIKGALLFMFAITAMMLCAAPAFAANPESDFTYTTNSGYATINSILASGDIVIPATLGGCTVSSINYPFLNSHSDITSLSIPSSVISINSGGITGCKALTAINVDAANTVFSSVDGVLYNKAQTTLVAYPAAHPGASLTTLNSVTSIDNYAFYVSDLVSISMPNVTSIGTQTFGLNTKLSSVSMPNVKTIGTYAFDRCYALTSITIPAGVTSIGSQALNGCSALTAANFYGNAPTMGTTVFVGCAAGFKVYYLNSSTGFTNPWYTYTTRIMGNSDVIYNGNGNSSGSVPIDALNYANGASVTVLNNSGNLSKNSYTFAGWNTAPDGSGTTRSPGSTFTMGAANVTLYALWQSVFTFTTNSNEATITGYLGAGGAVVIPSTLGGYPVTTIGNSAFFDHTNITSVTIPTSVTALDTWAFRQCSGLTEITIPSGVTSIDSEAFSGCTALSAIYADAGNTAYSSLNGVLYNKAKTTLVVFPEAYVGNSFTTPNSVTFIEEYAFEDSTLASVSMPNVTSTGQLAFLDCTNLTSVSMPNITDLGPGAFYICSKLTSVSMPKVENIGVAAFYQCSSLTGITIPSSVTTIGDGAFSGCSALISADFSGNAPTMGENVFESCAAGFKVKYLSGATGFTNQWNNYTTEMISSLTVTYDSNGNTGGNVPVDANDYSESDSVTVLGNTNSLVKSGYTFAGWNTAANGSGTNYSAGGSFSMGTGNVTLYARWTQASSSTVTPEAKGTFQFSAATYKAYEGSNLGVTITRTGGYSGAVGVSWAVTGATPDVDYTGAQSGTLTFSAGERSKTLKFVIAKDSAVELSDTLSFTISNPTGGATLGTQTTATANIADYIADTKTLKNTIRTLTAVNQTIDLRPGTSIEGLLLVTLYNKASFNTPPSDMIWKSSNPRIATVVNGVITAVGYGRTTITATYEKKVTTFIVNTRLKELTCTDSASNLLTAKTPLKMIMGGTQTVIVLAKHADGIVFDVTGSVVWTSSSKTIATVNNGIVTAMNQGGQSLISGTYGAKRVQVKVDSTLKSLISSVGADGLKLKPGDVSNPIVVTATYADASSANVRTSATWKSSNARIATVSNGVVTTTSTPGKVTISVSYGGKTVSFYVNTTLSSLVASKTTLAMTVGASQSVILSATYADGTTADVTSTAQWKSLYAKYASVVGGTITAVGKGRTSITASYMGKTVTIKFDSTIS